MTKQWPYASKSGNYLCGWLVAAAVTGTAITEGKSLDGNWVGETAGGAGGWFKKPAQGHWLRYMRKHLIRHMSVKHLLVRNLFRYVPEHVPMHVLKHVQLRNVNGDVGAEAEQDVEYEREFKCDQCEKIFADNNKLVRHMRDVHSDRKDCSLCTETFSSKRNFN